MSRPPQWVTEAGLCACCHKNPRTDGARCFECKEAQRLDKNEKLRRIAEVKVENGVCLRCNEPAVEGKVHCQKHLDSEIDKQRSRIDKGKCGRCSNPPAEGKRYCEGCLEKIREAAKANKLDIKLEVFERYGGAKCACCGDERVEALTVDHIEGGGRRHREEVSDGAGGHRFYNWLRKEGYPDGYQVLCFSCNNVKHQVGASEISHIPQHTEVLPPPTSFEPFVFPF